ncbi:MAG: triose-phosphate isomerase [Thermoanaerobaculaceae bacterium]|nr:triose-phosphate isomerase [Thermoanaerobaculaceae bacterium]
MRRPLLAANWKMHGNCSRVQEYLDTLIPRLDACPAEVVVCVPFTLLPVAAMVATGSPVAVGAQNCHWEEEGAFTGEISPLMLTELGVSWVIVGHSERRRLFNETDETACQRAGAAQRAGLAVIYCLGETLQEREEGRTLEVLGQQSAVLDRLDPQRLALAYEPVWAIGTGRNATPEQAQEAHAFLRGRCAALWGEGAAADVRILYGGSVTAHNAQALLAQGDVDGALVGGASLDVEAFSAIIRTAPCA